MNEIAPKYKNKLIEFQTLKEIIIKRRTIGRLDGSIIYSMHLHCRFASMYDSMVWHVVYVAQRIFIKDGFDYSHLQLIF